MDTVWICRGIMKEPPFYSFHPDENWMEVGERAANQVANRNGQALPRESFPTEMFRAENTEQRGSLEDFAISNGYIIVTEKLANVLRQFNLGDGALYPVSFFESDRTTPVEGTYYCLNIGNIKQALVPDRSKNVEPPGGYPGVKTWGSKFRITDNDIAVRETALHGPDIWVDPLLRRSIFVSGRLADAIREGGFGKLFDMKECAIIKDH